MTPTLITALNGKARPKNPHNQFVRGIVNLRHAAFESTVQWHHTDLEDGEYEAILQWQYFMPEFQSWENVTQQDAEFWNKTYRHKTRQVWRIVPQPQEKQTMEKKMIGAICKTCNSQELRNCAHPEECGNWEPIYEDLVPQKEEAKTVKGNPKLTDKVNYSQSLASKLSSEEINIINKLADLEPSCYADISQFVIEYSSQQNTALMEENSKLRQALEKIATDKSVLSNIHMIDIAIEALNSNNEKGSEKK